MERQARRRWRPSDGISRLFDAPGSRLSDPLADFQLILGSSSALVVVGVLMIWSASSVYASVNELGPYYYLIRQLVFLAVGVPLAWVLSRMNSRALYVTGVAGVLLSVFLLTLVFTPLGLDLYGNRSWLSLGPLGTIQPSEFAKVSFILFAAGLVAVKKKVSDNPQDWLPPLLGVFVLLAVLVLLQGDLGTLVVFGLILIFVLIFAGARARLIVLIATIGVTGAAIMIFSDADRTTRILSFLHPESAISDQPNNAIYALASGGWLGLGLGRSRQKWGGLYNGAQTDYVFAVLGEETGLVGTLGVIALFAVLIFAGFRASVRTNSRSLAYACAGMTAWIGVQAAINIAVVLRMAPVLGVPLPFLSQGGSALIANLAAVGVMLAAARHEPEATKTLAARSRRGTPRITSVLDTPGA